MAAILSRGRCVNWKTTISVFFHFCSKQFCTHFRLSNKCILFFTTRVSDFVDWAHSAHTGFDWSPKYFTILRVFLTHWDLVIHTVVCKWCHHWFGRNDAVIRQSIFSQILTRRPIARPNGWGIGCRVWFQNLFYILPQSVQWRLQYYVILDSIIMALHCT